MKALATILLLSSACFATLSGIKSSVSKIASSYSYCDSTKKLSRKKVLNLYKRSPAAHENYLSCKYLKKNARTDFTTSCKYKNGRYEVRGLKSYGGAISPIKMPYRYDLYQKGEKSVIEVRIFFKNKKLLNTLIEEKHTPEQTWGYHKSIQTYGEMLDFYLIKAGRLWSEFSPDENVSFNFVRVNKRSQAHFKVGYTNKRKGVLYNYKWNTFMRELRHRSSRNWHDRTISHEIGHMLGLEDEYSRFWGSVTAGKYFSMFDAGYKKDCSSSSLMCMPQIMWTTNDPDPQDYHYYQIFKRLRKCKR